MQRNLDGRLDRALDCYLGAWDMRLLNQPRKRIPVASWLIEHGECLGEIMYLAGQALSCVCFVIFVIWEALFGERHPHDTVQHRLREERRQAQFEENRRLHKLSYGNLTERKAAAMTADELEEAVQYRSKSGHLLDVVDHGPLHPIRYAQCLGNLQRDQIDLASVRRDIVYWQQRLECGEDAFAQRGLSAAFEQEAELRQRIDHMEKELNKVAQF